MEREHTKLTSTWLGLARNVFTGTINPIENLTLLTELDCGGNAFTGSINAIAALTRLIQLRTKGPMLLNFRMGPCNVFIESISALCNLTLLEWIWLEDNQLTGTIAAGHILLE